MEQRDYRDGVEDATQPIYFLDLVIENVRCFGERQYLDLSNGHGKPARWTVILGDNGTGKTTLLKCLASLEPIFVGGSREIVHAGQVRDFKSEFTFARDSHQDFLVKVNQFYQGWLDTVSGNTMNTDYGFQEVLAEVLPYQQVKELVIYGYGASRRMGLSSLEESYDPDNAASLFSNDVSLINAVDWLLQADYAMKSAEESCRRFFENRYEKVRRMLLYLLPYAEDIRVKLLTKSQLKPTVEVKTAYGWINMRELSLGYQTLIAWMVDLAHRLFERYPESDNPLAEPAIVLVDEIDLHLHPKWQRLLIGRLTNLFENTQFIVTAHSPLIVQASLEESNIVLLKREEEQVIIYNRKDEEVIKNWRIDQVLTSDLFELPSAQSPKYDDYLRKRAEILAKPVLTAEDKRQLRDISEKLEALSSVPKSHKLTDIFQKISHMLKIE